MSLLKMLPLEAKAHARVCSEVLRGQQRGKEGGLAVSNCLL